MSGDILQIVHVGVKVEDIGAPQSAREVGGGNVDLGLLWSLKRRLNEGS